MPDLFAKYTIPGLNGERAVRVHTGTQPISRRRGAEKRPLFILFDGQNVFDDAPSFSGGWHAHIAVDRLPAELYHVPIVVAVDHGNEQRIDELGPFVVHRTSGPTAAKIGHDRGGKADVLIDWIGAKLLPEVRARYAIVDGPLGVCIGGSSMGGLAAMYAHFKRPDLFGGAIVMSPSFWFGQRELFSFVAKKEVPPVSRIYLDGGLCEGGGNVPALIARMAEILTSRGYGPDKLKLVLDPRGAHGERHWRRRLAGALRFMYRKR